VGAKARLGRALGGATVGIRDNLITKGEYREYIK